jgi:hypothetical protein
MADKGKTTRKKKVKVQDIPKPNKELSEVDLKRVQGGILMTEGLGDSFKGGAGKTPTGGLKDTLKTQV